MNLSLKLFKATPSQLPPALLLELTTWMTKTPTYAEVAMRPGCVHLSTMALLSPPEIEALCDDVRGAVRRLGVCSRVGDGGGAGEAMMLQVGNRNKKKEKAAIVLDRSVRMILDVSASAPVLLVPEAKAVYPLAVTPQYSGTFMVLGNGIVGGIEETAVYCRSHGAFAQLEVLDSSGSGCEEEEEEEESCTSPPKTAPATGLGWIQVAVPHLQQGGYCIEFGNDPFMSPPVAFCVLDDEAAVAELSQLEQHYCTDNGEAVAAFIQKVGLLSRVRARVDGPLDSYLHEDVVGRVGAVAAEVATHSLLRGWPALLRLALDVLAVASRTPEQGFQRIEEALRCSKGGGGDSGEAEDAFITPLIAAVASQVPQCISVLSEWAEKHQCMVVVAEPLAFHLVPGLRDPCAMAVALMKHVPGSMKAWSASLEVPFALTTTTALSVALALGAEDLLQLLVAAHVPEAVDALMSVQSASLGVNTTQPAVVNGEVKYTTTVETTTGRDESNVASTSSSMTPTPKAEEEEDDDDDELHQPSISISTRDLLPPLLASAWGTLLGALSFFTRQPSPHQAALALYHFLLAVILPSLLPERLALGAALLAAVTSASSAATTSGPFLAWSMLRSTLLAVLAINLNRSSLMAQVRSGALQYFGQSPAVRAVISGAWVWAVAGHLSLGQSQHSSLSVLNGTLSLLPLPDLHSSKGGWTRLCGAVVAALCFTVFVPSCFGQILDVAGYQSRRRGSGRGDDGDDDDDTRAVEEAMLLLAMRKKQSASLTRKLVHAAGTA